MHYQPPGCYKEAINGIKLPPRIQIPIDRTSLDSNELEHWSQVQNEIARALGAKVGTKDDEEQDEEMKSEDIWVEETELAESFIDLFHTSMFCLYQW